MSLSNSNPLDRIPKKLFTPITINSMTLKNRLMMAPMGLGYTQDSFVNDRIIEFFKERAKGGVGLIDVGACRIHELGGGPIFIGLDNDKYMPGLKRLADEVPPIWRQDYRPTLPPGEFRRGSSGRKAGCFFL
jgi:hypothetical protein